MNLEIRMSKQQKLKYNVKLFAYFYYFIFVTLKY